MPSAGECIEILPCVSLVALGWTYRKGVTVYEKKAHRAFDQEHHSTKDPL